MKFIIYADLLIILQPYVTLCSEHNTACFTTKTYNTSGGEMIPTNIIRYFL